MTISVGSLKFAFAVSLVFAVSLKVERSMGKEWSLDSRPEKKTEKFDVYEQEKNAIQERLRKRYVEEKKETDERLKVQRAQRQQYLKRLAQEKYLNEKGFRRKSLSGKLQEERLREMGTSSFLPQSADGSARLEARQFLDKASRSDIVDNNFSVLGELEMTSRRNQFEMKIWNLARFDASDSERSRLIPYENWIAYKTNSFQAKVGMQIENWSMTEIFHPSDVFNSRNLDSELENAEKIGEPAASVRFDLFNGYATLYYMPVFLEPMLPSEKSRLSVLPEGAKLLSPKYYQSGELKDGADTLTQYAFRYTKKVGSGDIALHYLDHVDREQLMFLMDPFEGGVRPVFLRTNQWGVSGAFVGGDNLYKFDFVQRKFPDTGSIFGLGEVSLDDHSVLALGSERSFFHDNGWESTFFLEWQKVLGLSRQQAEDASIFQNDFMLGYRLAVNDIKGKEVKAFVIMDVDHSDELLWAVSYYQKIKTKLKISGGWRGLMAKTNSTRQLNDMDHVFVNLTYFF